MTRSEILRRKQSDVTLSISLGIFSCTKIIKNYSVPDTSEASLSTGLHLHYSNLMGAALQYMRISHILLHLTHTKQIPKNAECMRTEIPDLFRFTNPKLITGLDT